MTISTLAADGSLEDTDDLNLAAMIQPVAEENILNQSDFYNWGSSIIKGEDGKYHLFYAQMTKELGFSSWMTDGIISWAVADHPAGPYTPVQTVLEGRGQPHWDAHTAHNPRITKFDGKYYLYYVSTNPNGKELNAEQMDLARQRYSTKGMSPEEAQATKAEAAALRKEFQFNQRTGVAVADRVTGPWKRLDHVLLEPSGPIKDMTVNPAVIARPDGGYLMFVRGIQPNIRAFKRSTAVAIADSPLGPWKIQEKPALANLNSEDADVWYDKKRQRYYGFFHAFGYMGLITSSDGLNWERAKHYKVLEKTLYKKDGTKLQAARLERPYVYIEDGEYKVLTLAVRDKSGHSYSLTIPLRTTKAEIDPVANDNGLKEMVTSGTGISGPGPVALADQWELVGEAINEPGWDIWGSSPIRDDDGKIHLFCARWPGNIPFIQAWKRNSEIAHYISDRPEGPFKYVATIGKGIGKGWNAVGYHNPNIRKIGDKYVLVFISNDDGPKHGPNQRIGMMIADSLNGSWKLVPNEKQPLLRPPEDKAIWCHNSGCGVNNPSLLAHPDGRFLLYFKAMSGPRPKGKVKMGVAIANKLDGPYVIHKDPITANDRAIEDGYAFIWAQDDKLWAIVKDMRGAFTGKKHSLALFESKKGLTWKLAKYPLITTARVNWQKEGVERLERLERPQLWLENGIPAVLFCAAKTGNRTFNVHIPLTSGNTKTK